MYTHVKCLKDYYSALDRSKLLHAAGKIYKATQALADGFYSVECEVYEGQPLTAVGIQTRDSDYEFINMGN